MKKALRFGFAAELCFPFYLIVASYMKRFGETIGCRAFVKEGKTKTVIVRLKKPFHFFDRSNSERCRMLDFDLIYIADAKKSRPVSQVGGNPAGGSRRRTGAQAANDGVPSEFFPPDR